jgi:hypothetical protein
MALIIVSVATFGRNDDQGRNIVAHIAEDLPGEFQDRKIILHHEYRLTLTLRDFRSDFILEFDGFSLIPG